MTQHRFAWFRALLLLGCLAGAGWLLSCTPVQGDDGKLPRFTGEREAAALHFVKKHLPELLPLLEHLRKNSAVEYQREIRRIFQVTELLADISDDTQRHDLELKIWIAENRAQVLLAKLATPKEEERKAIQEQLQELARLLVQLDIDVLEHKIDMLDRELGEARDELSRTKDNRDKLARERYERLLQQLDKRKK